MKLKYKNQLSDYVSGPKSLDIRDQITKANREIT